MPALAGAAPPAPEGSLYTSDLWLLGSESEEDAMPAFSVGQRMKSMAAAAAEAAGGAAHASGAGDGAHIIAAASSVELHFRSSWAAPTKAGSASAPSSPRIAAVTQRPGRAAGVPEQPPLGPLANLLRRLSEQLPSGLLSGLSSSGYVAMEEGGEPDSVDPQAGATTPAAGEEWPARGPTLVAEPAAGAAPVELAEARDVLELMFGDGSTDDGEDAPNEAEPYAHISPAHLIAPAVPAWQPSPLFAPPGGSGGSQPSNPGAADGQQQAALPGQQQDDAAEVSVLSSGSSGCYSPQVAASRWLDSTGRLEEVAGLDGPAPAAMAAVQAAGESASAAASGSTSTGGSGWQRAREEGQVRRSLAHPIFDLQPGRDEPKPPQQRKGWKALVGLSALPDSQRHAGIADSSLRRDAWLVGSTHIHFDVTATAASVGGSPTALLLPAAGRQGRQGTQWGEEGSADEASLASGRYAALGLQLGQQLNLARVRRAVRADLKREKKKAAAPLVAPPRRSLLARLLPGCFHPAQEGDIPRRLRRALKEQRVQLLCLGRVPYNPDELPHWELWQAVCSSYAGLCAGPGLTPWQALGFSAANPATELRDTGLLALLYLLLLAERAPQLAIELYEAAAALGLPPAAAAVEAAAWTLRVLRCGELEPEARRMRCATAAAELFFLGAVDCCVEEVQHASPQVRGLPLPRLVLALMALAEEQACGNVAATVQRGKRAAR